MVVILDNDIYVLSSEIFKAGDWRRIKFVFLKFLKKFSTYFNKENVLENGLKNIVYSNKSTRKNVSSKLLVYFFKPLLLKEEKNKYVQYDFSEFNIEHILNDDQNEEIRYSLGNLLLCPDELNDIMRDSEFDRKRSKLLESNIPYLVNFANKYTEFNESNIKERNIEIVCGLKQLYLLSKEKVENEYNNLEIFFQLKEQLEQAFGHNSSYVTALEERGVDQFINYVYKNGSLPGKEVEVIKKMLPQTA